MNQPRSENMEDFLSTEQMPMRQLLLKIQEFSCDTIRLFVTHYEGRPLLEGFAEDRIVILIATALKTINTSQAICRLCAEKPYFEEMYVLTRSLIESIVNGVYIQFATDKEVEAFTNFDSISLHKAIRIAEGIAPDTLSVLPEKLLQDFSVHVDSVKAMLGKTEQDYSWTRLTMAARGDHIDEP